MSRNRIGIEVEKMLGTDLDRGVRALSLLGEMELYADVFASGLPPGSPSQPEDAAATGLRAAQRLRGLQDPGQVRRGLYAAYLSALDGLEVPGKKPVPLIAAVLGEGLKRANVEARSVPLILQGSALLRDARPDRRLLDVGKVLLLVKDDWIASWRVAEALGWMEEEDLAAWVTNVGLDKCWTWKPVADGKRLQDEFGVAKGPGVGEAIEAQTLWRLEHPRASEEEQLEAVRERHH